MAVSGVGGEGEGGQGEGGQTRLTSLGEGQDGL